MTAAGMELLDQDYVLLEVARMRPHPDNPNKGDELALEASVDEVGFYGAVLVREHPDEPDAYQILGGEHRWKLAARRHQTHLPGIVLKDVDDVQAIRILYNDNEVTRRGTYDKDALDRVLDTLAPVGGSALFDQILQATAAVKAAEDAEEAAPGGAPYSDDSGDDNEFAREYGILVMCDSELEQSNLFEQLAGTYGASKLRVVSV